MMKRVFLILMVIALGGGLYWGLRLMNQNQDLRRKAADEIIEADFYTNPSDFSSVLVGDTLKVDVIATIPGDVGVGVMSIKFNYDETKLSLTNGVGDIGLNSNFSDIGGIVVDSEGWAQILVFVPTSKSQITGTTPLSDPFISFNFEVLALGGASLGLDESFVDMNIVGVYSEGDVSFELKKTGGGVLTETFDLGGGGGPTAEPTAEPTSGGESDDGTPKLSFDFTFAGVRAGSKCVNNKVVDVTVMKGSQKELYEDVAVVASGEENSRKETIFRVSNLDISGDFSDMTGLAVFVKGPKHLQMKFGVDSQDKYYNVAGGEIDLEAGKVFDFSEYSLMAGDVDENGTVDAIDFVEIKKRAAIHEATEEGEESQYDLDGSCQVNTIDMAILVQSLNEKYDQVY